MNKYTHTWSTQHGRARKRRAASVSRSDDRNLDILNMEMRRGQRSAHDATFSLTINGKCAWKKYGYSFIIYCSASAWRVGTMSVSFVRGLKSSVNFVLGQGFMMDSGGFMVHWWIKKKFVFYAKRFKSYNRLNFLYKSYGNM